MIFMISKTVRIFSTTTHTRAVCTHTTRDGTSSPEACKLSVSQVLLHQPYCSLQYRSLYAYRAGEHAEQAYSVLSRIVAVYGCRECYC